jgi:Mn-dependent DtxR family transcriptional regulator
MSYIFIGTPRPLRPLREQTIRSSGAASDRRNPSRQVIDEKAIAAQLNVSRTPVREAVKRLVDEHLVDVIAQSATRAARIDAKAIEESYLIRRALEMESAAQAAAHMSQDHADRLADILMLHARAVERRQFVERLHATTSFIAPLLASAICRGYGAPSKPEQLDRCRYLMVPRDGQAEATLGNTAKSSRLNSRDPPRPQRR